MHLIKAISEQPNKQKRINNNIHVLATSIKFVDHFFWVKKQRILRMC